MRRALEEHSSVARQHTSFDPLVMARLLRTMTAVPDALSLLGSPEDFIRPCWAASVFFLTDVLAFLPPADCTTTYGSDVPPLSAATRPVARIRRRVTEPGVRVSMATSMRWPLWTMIHWDALDCALMKSDTGKTWSSLGAVLLGSAGSVS